MLGSGNRVSSWAEITMNQQPSNKYIKLQSLSNFLEINTTEIQNTLSKIWADGVEYSLHLSQEGEWQREIKHCWHQLNHNVGFTDFGVMWCANPVQSYWKRVENDEERSGSSKQLNKHKKNAHKPVPPT